MSAKNMDKVWKVFTIILGGVLMPLAGWVWNTNVAMAQLDNDLGDIESALITIGNKIEEMSVEELAAANSERAFSSIGTAIMNAEDEGMDRPREGGQL